MKKVYAKLSDQLAANGLNPTQKSDSLGPFESMADQFRSVMNFAHREDQRSWQRRMSFTRTFIKMLRRSRSRGGEAMTSISMVSSCSAGRVFRRTSGRARP